MSEWMGFTGGPVRGVVLALALVSVFGGCSKKEGDKAAEVPPQVGNTIDVEVKEKTRS